MALAYTMVPPLDIAARTSVILLKCGLSQTIVFGDTVRVRDGLVCGKPVRGLQYGMYPIHLLR